MDKFHHDEKEYLGWNASKISFRKSNLQVMDTIFTGYKKSIIL